MKAFRLGLSQGLVGLVLAAGCSGDKAPARGQIMLALHTDMALPKDVSKVKLQVITAGANAGIVKFDRTFSVGANGEAKIPATFAIVAPEGQSPTVEIRVIGIGGTKGRTFGKIVTTVPKDRIAALNMPIQWLCDGTATTVDSETFENTCPNVGDTETACVAGTCQDVNFPEVKMPDFSPPDVFGGGKDETDPSGKCFDTVACFDPGFKVKPDAACRVAIPAPPNRPFNFALTPTKATEGICGTKGCYIPLDKSEIFGWSELPLGSATGGEGGAPGTGGDEAAGAAGEGGAPGAPNFGAGSVQRVFQLPKAICDRVRDGRVASVLATAACDGKTERVPVCGDWYSVAAQRVTPETSTMTGSGGSGGGTSQGSCPEFKPGTGLDPVGNDATFNGMLQVIADFQTQSDALGKETFEACAGIVSDLGGKAPVVTGIPSTAVVTDTCTAAQSALKGAGAGASQEWSLLVTPGSCAISINDQASCESACPRSTCAANLPTADKRCAQLGGACTGSCNGDCAGTHDAPVTCSGTCDGICNGTCSGSCVSTDGLPSGTNCGGWCSGTCTGTCAGTCAESANTCEGTCWTQNGSCVGTLKELVCAEPLTTEDCFGDCGALCAARAGLAHDCQVPTAEVYGTVSTMLRTALDNHYWKLQDVANRSALLTSVAPQISQLETKYFTDSATTSDVHLRACLTAAQNSFGAGTTALSTALTQATQTALAVVSGNTPTGVCQLAANDTECTTCVKTLCCSEFDSCSVDNACSKTGEGGEFGCVVDCYKGAGASAATCEQGSACKISASATFSTVTSKLLECTHANCQAYCMPNSTMTCPGSQQPCNGGCVNVLTDATNCGACGNDCLAGQICSEGFCMCAGSNSLCPAGCVDLQNDRTNCGSCGALCGSSLTCVKGSCVGSGGAGGAGGGSGTAGAGASASAGAPSGGGTGGVGGATSGGFGGSGGTFTGGTAGSAGTAGASAATCPATQPQSSSGCPQQGLQCTFGATVCTCTVDGWSCLVP